MEIFSDLNFFLDLNRDSGPLLNIKNIKKL